MAQYTHNGNGSGSPAVDFIKGMVFGGLTGVTVALLLAPRSGEATRELILEKGDELRDRVSQTALETREQIAGLTQRVQQSVGEITEEVAHGAGALQERGREFVTDKKKRIEKTAEAAQRAAQESWSEPV